MQRDPRAFLWDVREAALAIQTFTTGLDMTAYENNELVQAAVERKFEVIGEALNQLSKLDATKADKLPDLPQIVAFRNRQQRCQWADGCVAAWGGMLLDQIRAFKGEEIEAESQAQMLERYQQSL
jgi:hypothetical protein